MPVTATHSHTKVLDNLRNQIASSATFQALVGADDQAGALARLFVGYVSDTDPVKQPPRGVIRLIEARTNQRSTTSFWHESEMYAIFQAPPPAEYVDEKDQYYWWLNTLAAIENDIRAQFYQPGRLNVDIETSNIGWIDPKQQGGQLYMEGFMAFKNGGVP